MLSWARESDLASDDGDEIDEGESMLPMFGSGSVRGAPGEPETRLAKR